VGDAAAVVVETANPARFAALKRRGGTR